MSYGGPPKKLKTETDEEYQKRMKLYRAAKRVMRKKATKRSPMK